MRAIYPLLALVLGTLSACPAFGIGRSGNVAILSESQGFAASTPDIFDSAKAFPDGKLRLISSAPDLGSRGFSPVFLDLMAAEGVFPQIATLSKAELKEALLSKGWIEIRHPDSCIAAFFKADAMAVAAFWGGGKGLVAVGPPSIMAQEGAKALLASLTLLPGACAW